MKNVKIVDSYLGFSPRGLIAQLRFQNKNEQYVAGPFVLTNLEPIVAILQVADADDWDELKGKIVQIEVENDFVTKVANILNEELCINLKEEVSSNDTFNQEQNK